MNNTAIRAEQTIMFANEHHRDFYYEFLPQCRHQDAYTSALIYCLGIDEDTRNHVKDIYDIQTGYVNPKCLRQGWITSGSARIIRMGFNLYCNGTPTEDNHRTLKDKMDEIRCYTVEDLFCCGYAPYFMEAIRLRYPEYVTKRGSLC